MVLLLVTACASHPLSNSPVRVVVTAAAEADQGDAARLRELTERAIASRGASLPMTVQVEYYGTAHAVTPSVAEPYQLIFARFTLANEQGRVLHQEFLRAKLREGKLETLRDAAEVIAQRVGNTRG
ncbi:MAG TPA: hypothetical protein VL284_19240 [Thermoanaerobaculia bacterium]|nr:hypothetical protein [Thermoanaerobaculia bacterium]